MPVDFEVINNLIQTAQKTKFPIKDVVSKLDKIYWFLWICSTLSFSLMENPILVQYKKPQRSNIKIIILKKVYQNNIKPAVLMLLLFGWS